MVSLLSVPEPFKNGAAAGISVGCTVALFNQIDTLKIRWQVYSGKDTLAGLLRTVLREEGYWKGLHRSGLICNSCSMGSASAIRMGLYPWFREQAVRLSGAEEKNAAHMFLAGLLPGGIGYFFASPLYQAKNRIQAENGLLCRETGILLTGARKGQPPQYHGVVHCLRCIIQEKALFRGASAMVGRGAALTAGQMLGYDGLKTYSLRHDLAAEGPALHVVASLSSAFFAAACCMPFDQVLVRYQTLRDKHSSGISNCVRSLWREEGVRGFYRGWLPLFSRFGIIFCIYMPAYEQLRARVFSIGYFK
ncbi:unnamed protein product [Amoebophrya sp. A120]|nr:unnamed protein product [Amoebophrya sp. A120]|eukprot:GSA120T00003443001.1